MNLDGLSAPAFDQLEISPTVKWQLWKGRSSRWCFYVGDDGFFPVRKRTYKAGNYVYAFFAKEWNHGPVCGFDGQSLSSPSILQTAEAGNPDSKTYGSLSDSSVSSMDPIDFVDAIDPACQLGWQQLAEAHFFARDYTAFRDAAERAMALNPRNSHTRAYLGLLIAFSGEWDRGMALVQRAMALNPHFPDWCYLPYFYDHYR